MAKQGKSPLDKLSEGLSGWKASFDRLRQRFSMPVAVLLTLSVAGGLVWWNWGDIAQRPRVEWVVAHLNQRALAATSAYLDVTKAAPAADQVVGYPLIKGAPVSLPLTPIIEIKGPKEPTAVDRTDIQLAYSVRLPSPDDSLRIEVLVDGAKVAAKSP